MRARKISWLIYSVKNYPPLVSVSGDCYV